VGPTRQVLLQPLNCRSWPTMATRGAPRCRPRSLVATRAPSGELSPAVLGGARPTGRARWRWGALTHRPPADLGEARPHRSCRWPRGNSTPPASGEVDPTGHTAELGGALPHRPRHRSRRSSIPPAARPELASADLLRLKPSASGRGGGQEEGWRRRLC
jgi:hypothetical protein